MKQSLASWFRPLPAGCLLFALAACGGGPTPAPPIPPTTGKVTGRIVDEKGEPMGERVFYCFRGGPDPGVPPTTGRIRVTTDRDGRFLLDDINPADCGVPPTLTFIPREVVLSGRVERAARTRIPAGRREMRSTWAT